MDTLIIGGPLTGRTMELGADKIEKDGIGYNLLTIDNIPICYCPEPVTFGPAFRELFWVYAKIPWSPGKLFIGGVANGDKMEYDMDYVECHSPKPFTPTIEKYLIATHLKTHRYRLQRFILDDDVYCFYTLTSLSLSDVVQLLVRNFIKVLNERNQASQKARI